MSLQERLYVGAGGTCSPPQIHLLPQIQKRADRSDVISEAPKCSKIQIFAGELTALPRPLADGEGARCPSQEPHPALGPSGLVSTGLRVQPITELATLLMTDFKCRPIRSSYFSVSENGDNGLSDEGADGACPPPRILGL